MTGRLNLPAGFCFLEPAKCHNQAGQLVIDQRVAGRHQDVGEEVREVVLELGLGDAHRRIQRLHHTGGLAAFAFVHVDGVAILLIVQGRTASNAHFNRADDRTVLVDVVEERLVSCRTAIRRDYHLTGHRVVGEQLIVLRRIEQHNPRLGTQRDIGGIHRDAEIWRGASLVLRAASTARGYNRRGIDHVSGARVQSTILALAHRKLLFDEKNRSGNLVTASIGRLFQA